MVIGSDRESSRKRSAFAAAVAALLLLVGCARAASPAAPASASAAPSQSGHRLIGHVSTTDCGKFGTYDIVNANVQVRDETGTLIGSTITDTAPDPICVVSFEVPGLPTASTYHLRVGYDDGPTYTLRELERAGWEVSFTLGAEESSSSSTMKGNGPGSS